ncbi:MAG: D-2-hydroxyacid dehydrogenase family protein [Methylobacteriaceae bacterium]|nr:D-2-hydroxyacid dehydrogenase family protein [Methylobacteriaceae bacterium]
MTETTGGIKIAVLDDYQNVGRSLADWASLAPRAQAVFFHDHVDDIEQVAARLADFEAVVLMRERTPITADLIARLPKLKLIVTVGMWNASVDFDAAKARGIVISGTPGGDPAATPALTWGLVLAVTRGITEQAGSVRAGGWQVGLGADIHGKTLGVLGLGKIGQAVAGFGKAFGMKVIAWSQNLTLERAAEGGVERVEKDELFRRADVLCIHLKLGERTRGLVGARELGLMKKTAYLVNTARGPIVDELALIAALEQRKIAGAALDVFDEEPLPQNHAFRYLPNVLATPHIGYVSEKTYRAAYPDAVEDIRAWLDGKPIRVLNG